MACIYTKHVRVENVDITVDNLPKHLFSDLDTIPTRFPCINLTVWGSYMASKGGHFSKIHGI